MGWNVGYTSNENNADDVLLFDNVTFRKGINGLLAHVVAIQENMLETDNEREEYEMVLVDIKDIADDPGIMDDPNMWEDQEFYTDFGHFWIVEN